MSPVWRGDRVGPLARLKVVELARVLAGPFCAQLLADAGADVIKVEPPTGDETRRWGPPYLPGCEPSCGYPGDSAYFASCNRGKRSIAVDLSTMDGREVVLNLIAEADVVIENFRPGTLERWGLEHEMLARRNPGLVTVSITGFGTRGPDASLPGYDFAVQAGSGLMSITGETGGPPMKVGVAVSDVAAGVTAAVGVLAALFERSSTGRGQRVETSLLASQISWLVNVAANWFVSGEAPSRYGNAHPNVVPYEIFATADRDIALAVGTDRQFARFAAALDHPDWADDDRYRTNAARLANREELVAAIRQVMLLRRADEWETRLRAADVSVSPVRSIPEVFTDLHVLAEGIVTEVDHPVAGAQQAVASPLLFGGRRSTSDPPPMFSQHAEEILEGLGYPEEGRMLMFSDSIVIPAAKTVGAEA